MKQKGLMGKVKENVLSSFRRHKILTGGLLIGTIFILVFMSLVVSSMSYDQSDPRALPNSYHSVETVIIDRPVADVFYFIQYEIPSIYPQMSPMHEKFEILNGDGLVVGAEVDCVEGDENEIVQNHYVVREVFENQLIAMSSEPTRVYNRKTGKLTAEVDVYDYFDFEPIDSDRTRLTQTVVLDMKSPFVKSIIDIAAFLSGTRSDWEQQFIEQTQKLAACAQDAQSTNYKESE